MPTDPSKNKWLDIEAQTKEALQRLGLENIDWNRPITPEDIQYLLNHWPYLQIVSTGNFQTLPELRIITAKSGWDIHYYGDAMSSSPGKFLIAGGDYRILLSDNEQEGGLVNPGKGTIWKQAYDTAAEMIALAQHTELDGQRLHWSGAKIVAGHPIMQFGAWMTAMDDEFSLAGYHPSPAHYAKRERVKRSTEEDQLLLISGNLRRPTHG